jgi:mono/diheme cytochrome c family protein
VVLGIVVIPGLIAISFFLMPFLDRKLERRAWRRPIPALAVAVVVLGMVFLGVKSQIDDRQGPIAEQLALQAKEEKAYSAAPFQPYVEPKDAIVAVSLPAGPANALIAEGKGIFMKRACFACHGATGMGTPAAPKLAGVTEKYRNEQIEALLRNPNTRMRAGRMPAVDVSPVDMSALIAYLGVIGTATANVQAVYRTPSPSPSPSPADTGSRVPSFTRKASLTVGAAPHDVQQTQSALPSPVVAGHRLFQLRGCFACHGMAGAGGRAPALGPLVAKLPDSELTEILEHPNAKMISGGMPPVAATRDEMKSLLSYLRSLPIQPSEVVPAAENVAPK